MAPQTPMTGTCDTTPTWALIAVAAGYAIGVAVLAVIGVAVGLDWLRVGRRERRARR